MKPIINLTILAVCALSLSCAYTPSRAYRLTDSEVHEAKHEYLERKVEYLQEQVYELRDKLEELNNE